MLVLIKMTYCNIHATVK